MSGDIAQLGIKIDSSQTVAAGTALDKFSTSAKGATTATGAMEAATTKATGVKKALGVAVSGVSGQLIAMAAGAGPVGVFLSALGPWGLAASVGLGAAASAFNWVTSEAARMGAKAVELNGFTAATGLTVAQLSALKKAGSEFGITGDMLQTSFERLTAGLQDARRATGPLYDDVQRISGALAQQLEQAPSVAAGIDVLAKAYKAAGDASAKVDLSKSIFGRGGAVQGPLLGKIADAGGLQNLSNSLKDVSVQADATSTRWAQMSAKITETEKRSANILASIFTEEGLTASLSAAQYMERVAVATKTIAETRSGWKGAILQVAQGAASMQGLPTGDLDAKIIKTADAARLPQETIAAWGQFEASLTAAVPAADKASNALTTTAKTVKELQDAAAATARTQQDMNAFLGSGATIADRLTGRLKDINAAYADNKTGAATDAEAKLLKTRAEGAAALDATMQRESMRIGVLGALATVQDAVRQKELEIAKANQQGAGITDKQAAAIKAYTAAQALGTLGIRQQTEAEKINAGAVGLGIGATAAYRAEQDLLAAARLKNQTLMPNQIALIKKEAAAYGEAAQKAAELKLKSDTAFATSQLGMTTGDQSVASQLRAVYGDKYTSEMDGAIAQQIRMNDTLKDTKAFGENALSGLMKDLRDGKTAGEAFQNVLTKLQDKLFDIASNQLMSALLKSGQGGLSSFISGLSGGAPNADGTLAGSTPLGQNGTLAGGAHEGAIVGMEATFGRYVHPAHFNDAPKFHAGGMIGMNEVPIIAKRGEGVFTPGQMAALAPAGSGGVTINVSTPAGTAVQATQSKDTAGNTQIDMKVFARAMDDTIASGIRSRESNTHAALKDTFGLGDKL